jgi:signal transduction histidine kinase/CheY-like chemotaxis protein/putative methionine-R-sulfoxide reductase with GAF domain
MKSFNIQSIKLLNSFILSSSEVSTTEGVTNSIKKILEELFNVEYIELYHIDQSRNCLDLISSKGFKEEEIALISVNALHGYPGKVYYTKKNVYIADSQIDNFNTDHIENVSGQFRTILYLPIQVQDKVIGVLGIRDTEPDKFKPEEIEFLTLLSNLSGEFFSKLQIHHLLTRANEEISNLSNELNRLNLIRDDIPQDKQYNELELANLRFKSLISSIQAGIMVEDEQRRVVFVNKLFCNLFSIPVEPDLLIGMSCEEAARASKTLFKDPESFINDIDSTLANRKIVTGVELPMLNGTILERDFIPIEDFVKKNFGILWIYRDITKRKKNESALLHQSRLLNGTSKAMNYLLTLTDHNEAISKALEAIGTASGVDRVNIFGNFEDRIGNQPLYNKLFEWSAPDILPLNDSPDFQNIHFAATFPRWYKLLASGKPFFGLCKDFPDDECRMFKNADVKSVLAAPIFVNDKLWGMVGFNDCTFGIEWSTNEISTIEALAGSIGGRISRRIIENELINARQNAENAFKTKSEFLATMSHEIRTPMNGVIGMTSLLMQTQLTYDQRDYAETIRISGELLLNLINDILDFSKIESGKMILEEQSFDLKLAVEEVIDLLSITAGEKKLGLYYEIDPALPSTIRGDLTRLRQILVNLTGNALKFTTVGEVVISVKQIGKINDVLEIEFSVKDTGMGIPSEKIDLLFKPFSQVDASTTRKYGGTGLGLAICYHLVKMMNGTIQVKSEIDRGSEFIFTIKIDNPVYNEYIKPKSTVQNLLKGKKILFADENQTSVEIIGKLLKGSEVHFLSAGTARMCQKILDNVLDIDLLIIDGDLSDMESDLLISSIKRVKEYRHCPVLMINYANVKENRPDKLGDSIIRITKPLKQTQLIIYINKIFSEKKTNNSQQIIQPPQIQKLNGLYPLTILVAEDNAINQKLITRLFEMLGYEIHLAANGFEAIKAVNNMNIDIVFMDIQMPEMDGIEATKQICAKWGDKKPLIVAMTANALQNDKEKCLEAGMDDYMSKPLTIDQVSKRVPGWASLCNQNHI